MSCWQREGAAGSYSKQQRSRPYPMRTQHAPGTAKRSLDVTRGIHRHSSHTLRILMQAVKTLLASLLFSGKQANQTAKRSKISRFPEVQQGVDTSFAKADQAHWQS